MLSVSVLGPVRVVRGDAPLRLGPRQLEVFSILLLNRGEAVPAGRLAELLWGAATPDGGLATVRSHVSHLRRTLRAAGDGAAGVISTSGSGPGRGYRLDLAPERIDAHRFEQACEQARRQLAAGRAEEAARGVEVLREALALWRGPAFADVTDRPFALHETARLTALRRSARLTHAEALAARGRYGEVIVALSGVVAEEPYDEALRRLLAVALYAEQRVDEAARLCRDGVVLLRERGLDAPDLADLQRRILRREVSLGEPPSGVTGAGSSAGPAVAAATGQSAGPTGSAGPAASTAAAPRLLPPDPPRFVGRDTELDQIRRRLHDLTDRSEIIVITGPPGVGKTSVAVRVAHAVADRFPDGQLYVDLRGFAPNGSAVHPGEVIRGFLDALGVPRQRLPTTEVAQAGLYRATLADRRMLVVLDNARDAEQVRPLLVGSPGSAVLVTSRNQLADLVAVEGAHPLGLGLPSVPQARRLLARRLGEDRVAGEAGAVADIIDRCGRLPLALAIVAARAATRPHFPLGVFVDELRDARQSLDGFQAGVLSTDIRAVFSWSYRALSPLAARLFCLLALHPGPSITLPAAASLAGAPPARVRPVLAELAGAHLIAEVTPADTPATTCFAPTPPSCPVTTRRPSGRPPSAGCSTTTCTALAPPTSYSGRSRHWATRCRWPRPPTV